MDRVRFVSHQGKKLLVIDLSHLQPEQTLQVLPEAMKLIAAQPPKSLLTLTDVTGATYDKKSIDAMKAYTKHNTPFVRAAAIVGADALRKALVFVIATFTGRDLRPFDDVAAAKDWLAKIP